LFHEDWSEEVGNKLFTVLVPLSDTFQIGLAYKDTDNEIRQYQYQLGKAIAVGGGLMHSTGKGNALPGSQDVLLCVYVGGKDEEVWDYALENIADELEHYMSPFDGWMRNENLNGRPSKCQ
jgi:hypothetical protein